MKLHLVNESQHPTDEIIALAKFALAEINLAYTHVHFTAGGFGGRGGYLGPHFAKRVREAADNRAYAIHVRVPEVYTHLGVGLTYKGPPGRLVKVEHFEPPNGGVYHTWEPAPPDADHVGPWPIIVHNTWQEYIVGMTAHEGKHVEQARHRLPFSEVAAEHFEQYTLRRFREQR